jgi:hypothetical protein
MEGGREGGVGSLRVILLRRILSNNPTKRGRKGGREGGREVRGGAYLPRNPATSSSSRGLGAGRRSWRHA